MNEGEVMQNGNNYLDQKGKALIRGGYNIIPIKLGEKGSITGWSELESTPELVDRWVADGLKGVGVLCKDTPAIDLDILDEELCEVMVKKVREVCGESAVRTGRAPKVLLPFRTSEPFKKITSSKYTSPDGKEHQVEILGDGQQFVSHNIHKETGNPYHWDTDLTEIAHSDLPVLTEEQAREIIKFFEEQCEALGWKRKKPKSRGRSTSTRNASTSARDADVLGLTPKQMKRELDVLDPEKMDYEGPESWLTVGMGLCHETGGSQIGYDLWVAWSERSSKHSAKEMPSKWKSFAKYSGRSITFRTVRGMANRAKLDNFLERYVYIEESDRVHDLRGDLEKENPILKNFKNMHAGVEQIYEVRNKTITAKVTKLWLNHPDRKSVTGLKYTPTADNGSRIVEHNGDKYLNPFHMPVFPEPDGGMEAWEKLIAPFTEHMEYLFPVASDREWFLDWMAWNIQRPEKRCKVAPLHIAIHHGTGRGWIVKVMEGLLGDWNCSRVKMKELVENNYGEFLYRTLLCSIEEVREGASKGFEVNDAIRDVLIEDRLNVNLKYGWKGMADIYTNFFMMSNHPDALILTNKDRRINVFKCDEDVKPEEVYEKIYKWQEGYSDKEPSVGMCALHHILKARDLKDFNDKSSIHNEARDEMIMNRQSAVEWALDTFLEDPPYFAMKMNSITECVKNILLADTPDGDFETTKIEYQLNKLLSHRPFLHKRIRINTGETQTRVRGTKVGTWTDEEIKAEMRRQQPAHPI
jgi:hypothetical protein